MKVFVCVKRPSFWKARGPVRRRTLVKAAVGVEMDEEHLFCILTNTEKHELDEIKIRV